jgi:hypothetical protein
MSVQDSDNPELSKINNEKVEEKKEPVNAVVKTISTDDVRIQINPGRLRVRSRSISPVNRNNSRYFNPSPIPSRRVIPPLEIPSMRSNISSGHGIGIDVKKPAVKKQQDNDSSSSEENLNSTLSPGKLTILNKASSDRYSKPQPQSFGMANTKGWHGRDDEKLREEYINRHNAGNQYTKEQIDNQRRTIQKKIEDVEKMLKIELKEINKKSDDPKKERRRERIEKLFSDAKDFSEMDYDMDTWREIEDYWEELRAEQYDRLKDNVGLTDDTIIDNDFLIVDSGEHSNKNIEINDDEMLSISLDIVAIYLKGQKILYTEAKTFCEQQLNFLMMPAIFISALTTVLSMALDKTGFGSILIASLTAVNSFLLAIISYLKLDAKSEAHKTSAYQFDKLQSKCEFGSGRVIFFSKAKYLKDHKDKDDQYTAVFGLIDEIELKVTEIKDMNKFILPERVRRALANLYGVNVFSAVKSFLTSEKYLKAELSRCIEIQKKYNDEIQKVGISAEEREKYRDLIYTWNVNMKTKRDIERKLIEERENYMKLDRSMLNDISSKHVNQMDCCCCNCCGWLKT